LPGPHSGFIDEVLWLHQMAALILQPRRSSYQIRRAL